jgi:hypothetical protein
MYRLPTTVNSDGFGVGLGGLEVDRVYSSMFVRPSGAETMETAQTSATHTLGCLKSEARRKSRLQ